MKSIDLLGVGNAIVDSIIPTNHRQLGDLGLAPGSMSLVDAKQAANLRQTLPRGARASGGSVANACAIAACLGCGAGFIGKVADDALGAFFTSDLDAVGVAHRTPALPGAHTSGHCIVLVTPDGQRTMATHLGASSQLAPHDIDADAIAHAKLVLTEAYLLDSPQGPAILGHILDLAASHATQVALSLSDAACVARHRPVILQALPKLSLLFANAREIMSLCDVTEFEAAAAVMARLGCLAILTRSESGSVVVHGPNRWTFAAAPATVVDTTGAGDSYAAGFLSAYLQGAPIEDCGRRGSRIAALCIAQYGARPAKTTLAAALAGS